VALIHPVGTCGSFCGYLWGFSRHCLACIFNNCEWICYFLHCVVFCICSYYCCSHHCAAQKSPLTRPPLFPFWTAHSPYRFSQFFLVDLSGSTFWYFCGRNKQVEYVRNMGPWCTKNLLNINIYII